MRGDVDVLASGALDAEVAEGEDVVLFRLSESDWKLALAMDDARISLRHTARSNSAGPNAVNR